MDPHPRPVYVVTGATSGIGRALVEKLRVRSGTVVAVGRDRGRIDRVVATFQDAGGAARIEGAIADLSRISEVHRLADELLERFPHVDVLVNNAGAFFARREVTEEGHERTWALNVLAPFLLTHRLAPRLIEQAPTRVVNVASAAHERQRLDFDHLEGDRHYRGFRQYGRSKLALVLLTYEFAARLAAARVAVNAMHPGFVRSGFGQNNGGTTALVIRALARAFGITPERGAQTPFYLATAPDITPSTGAYFVREHAVRSSSASYDLAARARVWDACAQATGIPRDALVAPATP